MSRRDGGRVLAFATALLAAAPVAAVAQAAKPIPIALHPGNSHYFLWRGRPTILLTSGEHYGAVLNLDFDYRKYLDTLAADGMNYTRVFSGAYVEPEGAFKIARNTLAPRPGRFIAPWPRSKQPGHPDGGNKFDLSRWDDAYFARLKDFVAHAATRDVVVELTLFCPMYEEVQWSLSPMNAANNVNGAGKVGRNDVYTLDRDPALLAVQEALTRKLVTELNAFPNLFFEIANEPYFGGITMPWQHRIADVIVETERPLPAKHLIAQNIANKSAKVADPHPAVSIFNFHYATPPETVAMNYALDKAIGDDETGFKGVTDEVYRMEGWDFVIAGGALYNNLDYSFAVGYEDGTFQYPSTQPGGGSRALRGQLKILGSFINGFDFLRMAPDNAIIKAGVPPGGTARALVEPGRAIAIYLRRKAATQPAGGASPISGESGPSSPDLQIALTEGAWRAEWVDTMTGSVIRSVDVSGGGVRPLTPPDYVADVALRLRRQSSPSGPPADFADFLSRVDAAQLELQNGRASAFKALWSHGDDVTLSGGFGGPIEKGWEAVGRRLDWVGTQFSNGTNRIDRVVSSASGDVGYVIQAEYLKFRVPGQANDSTRQYRVTMIFRREAGEWRIVHRQADSQVAKPQ